MEKILLGAATAAHQVEGNNLHSDFWAMEHMKYTNFNEPSNDAVDHYNRFKEDIDYIVHAGLNTYRFSIEWARIEPIKGEYNKEEIAHYRYVLDYCIKNGLTPIVTLHHFSSPKWLIEEGGWEDEHVIAWFADYCGYVTQELGDYFTYVCTINEANMGTHIAKKIAAFKKGIQSVIQVGLNDDADSAKERDKELLDVFGVSVANTFLAPRSQNSDRIVFEAHKKAKAVIKAIKSTIQVGITLSLHDFQYVDEIGKTFADKAWYEEFEQYLDYIKEDDFFGVQNYTRGIFDRHGAAVAKDAKLTQMNYENYPWAIGNVVRKVSAKLAIPILITENGIATDNDADRIRFIDIATEEVKKCLDDNIQVIGYLYWSLLDNFEWQKGYDCTFGLIAVDRMTQQRYPKESLAFLGSKQRVFNQP